MDVEDHDLDVLGCKELHEKLPDAIASASDDHKLFLPVPGVALPIIKGALA